MNLTFAKKGDKYEAVAAVSGSFNIHIEGGGDLISVYQRTAGTKYCMVREACKTGDCYDNDFFGEVYPKDIKVVCEDNPQVAILTEAQ